MHPSQVHVAHSLASPSQRACGICRAQLCIAYRERTRDPWASHVTPLFEVFSGSFVQMAVRSTVSGLLRILLWDVVQDFPLWSAQRFRGRSDEEDRLARAARHLQGARLAAACPCGDARHVHAGEGWLKTPRTPNTFHVSTKKTIPK